MVESVSRVQKVSANGLSFPVHSWGDDSCMPVMLLHGFPQMPETWGHIAISLANAGFYVLAPLQRGYSNSTRTAAYPQYAFMDFVDDAIGIADALGLSKVDVIGFGVGGMQAWLLAATHPTRVRKLISLRYPHPAAFAEALSSNATQIAKWSDLQSRFGSQNLQERADAMLANDAEKLRAFLRGVELPQSHFERYLQRLLDRDMLMGAFAWERSISINDFLRTPVVRTPSLLMWSHGPGLAEQTVLLTKKYVSGPYKEILLEARGNWLLESYSAELLPHIHRHLKTTTAEPSAA